MSGYRTTDAGLKWVDTSDPPFGVPPDHSGDVTDMVPRCSCGGKSKISGTIDGKPACGRCIRRVVAYERKYPNGTKRSKYGVDTSPAGKLRRTRIVDEKPFVFASEGEAKRYDILLLLQQQKFIRRLELQPRYPIVINGVKVCEVVLDFRYFEGSTRQVEDFKGRDTPLSKLKRKLVEASYPGTKVKVTK